MRERRGRERGEKRDRERERAVRREAKRRGVHCHISTKKKMKDSVDVNRRQERENVAHPN